MVCGSCNGAGDNLRFSRHLQDEFPRSNSFTMGVPNGYTHNCLCGGGHGCHSFEVIPPSFNMTSVTTTTTMNPPQEPCCPHGVQPHCCHHCCVPPGPQNPGPPPQTHRPAATANSVRWNKTSMLRHINQAQKNEMTAKNKMWATNRFGVNTPGLETFRFGGRVIPKKYLKYPHDTHHGHGYCPVHPESTCMCAKCSGGTATASCSCKRRDEQGWHNEGFDNNRRDRLPPNARTASEQRSKSRSKSPRRRPFIPRGDRTYDPPIHSTFAGSRTKGKV
ncbi:hypothetical protein CAPTEDRAFT_224360 [Capitella teleta]|uniref:Uncharacterized protein n=1 Tax=Capitella teleta TaxID=283909 RepID=R7TI01_CAPTE|nr:hypothetical protein CAPTEDRAFT_224360 [Capitella teleta]|eukprot:ELT93334.1 hypothetical protein CAPTEDRAFT_224360 [Capitella teleta]